MRTIGAAAGAAAGATALCSAPAALPTGEIADDSARHVCAKQFEILFDRRNQLVRSQDRFPFGQSTFKFLLFHASNRSELEPFGFHQGAMAFARGNHRSDSRRCQRSCNDDRARHMGKGHRFAHDEDSSRRLSHADIQCSRKRLPRMWV